MISLQKLLKTTAPSTKIYVYYEVEEGFVFLGKASQIVRWLEEDDADGIVPYFTTGAGRLNIFLEKIGKEQS
jgi:hypothetical protein